MTTTTNLSDFGSRERNLLVLLLQAWDEQGLPQDFSDDAVVPMMNQNSGNVFLTNSDYQVAMLNGGNLESFYVSPYEGKEGFFDDLLSEYADMHEEDKEWFRDIAENLGRSDDIPVTLPDGYELDPVVGGWIWKCEEKDEGSDRFDTQEEAIRAACEHAKG